VRASRLVPVAALLLVASIAPRPATVVEADATESGLAVSPAIAVVAVEPGEGALVPLQLLNGSEQDVPVTLSAVAVDIDGQGRPQVTRRGDGPATWISFAEDRVVLQARTVTALAPAVNVPASESGQGLVAVRATGDAGRDIEVVAIVALTATDARPAVVADVSLRPDDGATALVARLTNGGQAAAVLTLRSAVTSWTGRRLVDETTAPVLVAAGTSRHVVVGFRTPTLPGPYTAEIVVVGDVTMARARTTTVLWNPPVALPGLALLLVLTSAALWWRTRTRTRNLAGSAAEE